MEGCRLKEKTDTITLRLSPTQHDKLRRLCQQTGLSQSAIIRALLDEEELISVPANDLQELLKQLVKIGTNLNQIAYKANSLGVIDSGFYWQQADQLQDLRIRLMRRLLQP